MTQRHFAVGILSLLAVAAASSLSAQSITSARSGTLHYFDGDVSLDGSQITQQRGTFPQIKEQGVLRTGLGRAEVLLTPGVFLRVGENSSIRVIDERLISTRVEIVSGTAMVESDDPRMSIKDSPVTLIYGNYEIQPLKHGLIEISANPAQVKVYKGEAQVLAGESKVVVNEGHLAPLTAALASEKFSDKTGDDLYVWTRDRSESLAAANVNSAQSLSAGTGYGFANTGVYGSASPWQGGWYYNPYYDMYTMVPGNGAFFNPFGYGFFSPGMVNYYVPSGGGGTAGLSPAVRGGSLISRASTFPVRNSVATGGGASAARMASSGMASPGMASSGRVGGGAGGGAARGHR